MSALHPYTPLAALLTSHMAYKVMSMSIFCPTKSFGPINIWKPALKCNVYPQRLVAEHCMKKHCIQCKFFYTSNCSTNWYKLGMGRILI